MNDFRYLLKSSSNLVKNIDRFVGRQWASLLNGVFKTPVGTWHDNEVAVRLCVLTRVERSEHVFKGSVG